jgi:hypothetical protein
VGANTVNGPAPRSVPARPAWFSRRAGAVVQPAAAVCQAVDFGASDLPLDVADLAADRSVQFPTVIGGVDGAFANGDKMAAELECVSLADSVEAPVRKAWGDAKDASGKVVAFR